MRPKPGNKEPSGLRIISGRVAAVEAGPSVRATAPEETKRDQFIENRNGANCPNNVIRDKPVFFLVIGIPHNIS